MSFLAPKLALREATSLRGRRPLSPEAFEVLDKLAHCSGVRVSLVSLWISSTEIPAFTLPMSPDTAVEVLNLLSKMNKETNGTD